MGVSGPSFPAPIFFRLPLHRRARPGSLSWSLETPGYSLMGAKPKRAHLATPDRRANHQSAILQHGIVADPNVLPALAGVRCGALLYLLADCTAMPFVVIYG